MSVEESYLFLFFDSIMASLALITNTPMVFNAMKIIGGFNYEITFIIAVIGNAIGSSLNYILGRLLNCVKKNIHKSGESKKFISLKEFSNKRLFVLGFFSFVPLFGVVITLAAGFLRVSYLRFISLVILGRLVYYIFLS